MFSATMPPTVCLVGMGDMERAHVAAALDQRNDSALIARAA